MVMCERCYKEFPYPWKLRRHLERKNICTPTANDTSPTANDTFATANDTSSTANDTIATANDTFKISAVESVYSCKYCNKVFQRHYNKTVHESKCKENDEIWSLENMCKIEHIPQKQSNECKYCTTKFSRTSSLTRHLVTCERKKEYKLYLESRFQTAKPQENTTINNNTTQNANTINNTTINIQVLGQESMEHITVKKIEKILNKIMKIKYPGDNNLYKISAETVADVHKLMRTHDENRNIIIPHERRQIALVKRDPQSGFVKEEITTALDDGFRNTSKKLYDVMKDIDSSRKTKKIHKCVESFSRKGFRGHPEMPKNAGKYSHRREDLNNARRKFKLANMYNGTINDSESSDDELENVDLVELENFT